MSELVIAIVGLNTIILAAVLTSLLYNSRRVGRIEGILDNGDYLRCPFYRAKNKGCNNGKRSKGNP